jgi:carboxymethylenebutenolidase
MKILSSLPRLPFFALTQSQKRPRGSVQGAPGQVAAHHEWVDLKRGERSLHCFVVYPEVKTKAAAVLVIHENKGLTDWVRSVADQLAEAGYIAIAPDLLSGAGRRAATRTASPASTRPRRRSTSSIQAGRRRPRRGGHHCAQARRRQRQAVRGGLLLGGSTTFEYAWPPQGLAAACVFYGGAPKDDALLAKIDAPVYGFYGESDERNHRRRAQDHRGDEEGRKTYEPVTYSGAGHGFFRAGEAADASEPNRKARQDAWVRLKELLAKHSAK